jgi:hypothetical protein
VQRVAEQRSHASTKTKNLTSHATKNNAKNSNQQKQKKAMLVVSVQGSSDLMRPGAAPFSSRTLRSTVQLYSRTPDERRIMQVKLL